MPLPSSHRDPRRRRGGVFPPHGAAEEETHERLKAHLQELVSPKIKEHRGRIVKNGFLAEFPSVVDAVRCGVEIQRGMVEPLTSGFEMFALVVAPMLFLCALLLAHKRTHLIGFFSAQLFASAGVFQNRMAYDPVGLINTSIAAMVAAAVAMVTSWRSTPASPSSAPAAS